METTTQDQPLRADTYWERFMARPANGSEADRIESRWDADVYVVCAMRPNHDGGVKYLRVHHAPGLWSCTAIDGRGVILAHSVASTWDSASDQAVVQVRRITGE